MVAEHAALSLNSPLGMGPAYPIAIRKPIFSHNCASPRLHNEQDTQVTPTFCLSLAHRRRKREHAAISPASSLPHIYSFSPSMVSTRLLSSPGHKASPPPASLARSSRTRRLSRLLSSVDCPCSIPSVHPCTRATCLTSLRSLRPDSLLLDSSQL